MTELRNTNTILGSGRKRKVATLALFGLFVTLLLGTLFFVAYTELVQRERRPTAAPDQAPVSKDGDAPVQGEPTLAEPLPVNNTAVPQINVTEESQRMSDEIGPYPLERGKYFDETFAVVELIVQDESGNRLPRLQIEFDVSATNGPDSLDNRQSGMSLTDTLNPSFPYTRFLDDNGSTQLRVRTPSQLSVTIRSPGFCLPNGTGVLGHAALPGSSARLGESVFDIGTHETQRRIALVAVQSLSRDIQIAYADGLSFEGMASCTLVFRGRPFNFSPWSLPVQNGRLTFGSVPHTGDITIALKSNRLGFASTVTETVSVQPGTGMHSMVIPWTSELQAQIVLRFPATDPAQSVNVRIINAVYPGQHFDAPATPPCEVRSGILRPGVYHVLVDGDVIWEARNVTLSDKQVEYLDVTLTQPASVTGRIIGPNGKPLEKVIVCGESSFWPSWPAVASTGETCEECGPRSVIPDSMGSFALRKLGTGGCSIWIKSPTFEMKIIQLTLSTGESRNVGEVSLDKATSRVRVNVTGKVDGRRYMICLLEPGGIPIGQPVESLDDHLVLYGVPLGRYRACVYGVPSGKTVSVPIEVVDRGLEHIAEVDVSQLETSR